MQNQNEEQAIRQLVSTWLSATEAGNDEQVLSLIADNAVFLMPGQPPMTKADFAANQAAHKQFYIHIDSEIQEVQVVGEWAYCWNKLNVVMSPHGDGTTFSRSGNSLSIFQKQAGAWLIVRDANMLVAV
ncbi:MAG: SgcJ/EcaC family oxidoreductase [Methylobacter sp.]|nr:SgcJ/EcaC family oxidoreductase [Methylobacter sp.]